MRHLPQSEYDQAHNLLTTLAICGDWATEDARILDFGCGSGNLVYSLRDKGYEAFGYDLYNCVDLRDPCDASFFRFHRTEWEDLGNTTFDRDAFSLPYSNSTFDVVFSTTVIEHVLDLDWVVRELSRVMKPDGVSLHVYPSKSSIIEPHILVPFATRYQSWLYFYFWAMLGIRNSFQVGMRSREVADVNVKYCRTGLRYRTYDEIFCISERYFERIECVDARYNYGDLVVKKTDRIKEFMKSLRSPSLQAFIAMQRSSCLLLAVPRPVSDT